MLAINLPYLTCSDFDINQDLSSGEFSFKLENKREKEYSEVEVKICLENRVRYRVVPLDKCCEVALHLNSSAPPVCLCVREVLRCIEHAAR